MTSIIKLARRSAPVLAFAALLLAMGGTWVASPRALAAPNAQAVTKPNQVAATSQQAGHADEPRQRPARKEVSGKLNLNTATEEQLMLLPTVGPSKAERIVAWRKKNGGFKRVADLRRVKGFGYRTYKRLEPFLDIKGDTTLAARRCLFSARRTALPRSAAPRLSVLGAAICPLSRIAAPTLLHDAAGVPHRRCRGPL